MKLKQTDRKREAEERRHKEIKQKVDKEIRRSIVCREEMWQWDNKKGEEA